MMDRDEFENGGQEAAPIDMLAAFFEAHGWSYDQVGEDEIVASTQGSWAQYELRGIWRDEDQVLQMLPRYLAIQTHRRHKGVEARALHWCYCTV